jgi:deoxycytidylate deaminase
MDPSTQNAAVLIEPYEMDEPGGKVYSETYAINQFPYGVHALPERWERPLKYRYVEHAERGAIYKAARYGIPTEELVMVCPWMACTDCARALILAGIPMLVTHKQAYDRSPTSWIDDLKIAKQMLSEAGVSVEMVDAPKLGAPPVLHSGEVWEP